MPELPEIALTREYVNSTVLNKKILDVDFPSKSLLQSSETEIKKALKGQKILKSERLGKYLFLNAGKNSWLVLHFGMTGKLEYYQNQEAPKYSQMIFSFEDNSFLSFVCRRKLGKIYLAKSVEEFKEEHSLGKDALDFSREDFEELLNAKKGSIKATLTDQHSIAGIGNVYSDEILYQVKVHPKSKAEKLTGNEKKDLFEQIEKVLELAIEKGGKRSEFPSNFLINHRKEGADCPNCKGKVKQIKVSGRSTYFCPSCQKEKL